MCAKERSNTKQKIVELLKRNKELSQREIANKLGLTDSTIYYHLKELERDGVITRGKKGYRLREDEREKNVLKLLAKCLKEGINREDDQIRYIIENEKTFSNEKEVKSFLELLKRKGYIHRSFTRYELTSEGARIINVCTSCLEPIEENDNIVMIYDVIDSSFGELWVVGYAIHQKCLSREIEAPVGEIYFSKNSLCSYCGLPLSRELFMELCIPPEITVEDVIESLTPEEIMAIELGGIDKKRPLETFNDVRLFVTEVRLFLEKGSSMTTEKLSRLETANSVKSELESIARKFNTKTEIVEEIFHRDDVKKRAADIYRRVLLLNRKWKKELEEAFNQLLDPLGRIYTKTKAWWHITPKNIFKWEDLIDPFKDGREQTLVIKRDGKLFHPYCYGKYVEEKNLI